MRESTMTLSDIEAYPKNLLTAAVVGRFLNIDPMYIRYQARKAPEKLGFPVMTYGKCSVRIPKEGFINFYRGRFIRSDKNTRSAD